MYQDIEIREEFGDKEIIRVRYCDQHEDFPVVVLQRVFVSEYGGEFGENSIVIPAARVDDLRLALRRVVENARMRMFGDDFLGGY